MKPSSRPARREVPTALRNATAASLVLAATLSATTLHAADAGGGPAAAAPPAAAAQDLRISIRDFRMGRMKARAGARTGSHVITQTASLRVFEATDRIPIRAGEVFGVEFAIDTNEGNYLLVATDWVPPAAPGSSTPPAPLPRRAHYFSSGSLLSVGMGVDDAAGGIEGTWTLRATLLRVDDGRITDDAVLRQPNTNIRLFERSFTLERAVSPPPASGQ